MTTPDPHGGPGHGDVILSLTEETPGGGRRFQSWTICDCALPALRSRLGPPEQETVADAETVRRTGEAVLAAGGSTCKHCRKPIVLCASVPAHAGCGSGYGWIHSNPEQWGHGCQPRSGAPYAQPLT